MNGSAIENSCITKYVYRVLSKMINQSINQSTLSHWNLMEAYIILPEQWHCLPDPITLETVWVGIIFKPCKA